MKLFYAFAKALVWLPFKIVYPSKVINKKNRVKNKRVIVVANHLRWTDVVTIAFSIPGYRHIIAKKEVGKNPIVRKLAKWLGVILVDRGNVSISSVKNCVKALKKGEGLAIFPEGTRNKEDTSLQEVKSGVSLFAIKGEADILPVMLTKSKAFRRTLVYVGESFSLKEFHGRAVSAKVLDEATQIVGENMQRAKDSLDDYIQNRKRKPKKVKMSKKLKSKRRQPPILIDSLSENADKTESVIPKSTDNDLVTENNTDNDLVVENNKTNEQINTDNLTNTSNIECDNSDFSAQSEADVSGEDN